MKIAKEGAPVYEQKGAVYAAESAEGAIFPKGTLRSGNGGFFIKRMRD